MLSLSSSLCFGAAVVLLPLLAVQHAFVWGPDGHKLINRLAGAALPADVPAFIRSPEAIEALGYYGPSLTACAVRQSRS